MFPVRIFLYRALEREDQMKDNIGIYNGLIRKRKKELQKALADVEELGMIVVATAFDIKQKIEEYELYGKKLEACISIIAKYDEEQAKQLKQKVIEESSDCIHRAQINLQKNEKLFQEYDFRNIENKCDKYEDRD